MISSDVARVVLSGSYRKDRIGLKKTYDELIGTMCQVISPHRLEFDEAEFVRDQAEMDMHVRNIEDHHLMSIKQADFVWLFAPNGYVGTSAAFEVGYAHAVGTPVFAREQLSDQMLGEFVTPCPSIWEAKQLVLNQG